MSCSWKSATVTSSAAILRASTSALSTLREKAPTVVLTLASPTLTSRMGGSPLRARSAPAHHRAGVVSYPSRCLGGARTQGLQRGGRSVHQARGPHGLEPTDELPHLFNDGLEALAHVELGQ